MGYLPAGDLAAAITRPSAATLPAPEPGSLTITLSSVPSGLVPSVTVTGPAGYRIVIHASVRLGPLTPGTYNVSASPLPGAASTHYPTITGAPARVSPGQNHTCVRVSYFDDIPDTTFTPPGAAVVSASGQPGAPQTITLAGLTGGLPHAPAAGDIIALGPTAATPDGLLGRVTSITRSSGDLVVATTPATLLQAITAGQFSVSATPSLGGQSTRAAQRDTPATAKTGPAWQGTAGTSGFPSAVHKDLTCHSAAGAAVAGTLSIKASATFSASWRRFELKSASAVATVKETAALTGTASADADCDLSPTDILPAPIQLPRITIQIGPVPVVIRPKIELNASGNASTTADLHVGVSQNLTAKAGLSYAKGSYSTVRSLHNSFSFTKPTVTATGSIKVAVGPEIQLLVYGQAGPDISIYPYLKLAADTASSPWWKLYGGVNAGGGLTVAVLHLNHQNPHIISFSKELAHASGGSSPPPPPSLPGGGTIYGVKALTPAKAWAVGFQCVADCGTPYSGTVHMLLMQWNGKTWSQPALPKQAPAGEYELTGVSATSTADAWAAGNWVNGTHGGTLLLHWNGTTWSEAANPTGTNPADGLYGVSQDSPTDAWAVGSSQTSDGNTALILHWNGRTWSQVTVPHLSPTGGSALTSVTAASPTNVWAAGRDVLLHWNGTAWAQVTYPTPGDATNELESVSADSPTDAWAAGTWTSTNPDTQGGLLAHWNGHAWSQVATPGGSPAVVYLSSVSSDSARDAWATGETGTLDPILLHWNGAGWSRSTNPDVGIERFDNLQAVSADSASDAWAVGVYCASSTYAICDDGETYNTFQPMLLHWNGEKWSPTG